VFNGAAGPAVNASIVDMGDRFRLIVNKVNAVVPEQPLPNLPVARSIWNPEPNLKVAAAAWIFAGGAHHTSYSQALTAQHLEDFAEMASIEYLLIDSNTTLANFKKELRWNDLYYRLAMGF
jgi:L-arabinose isomerase